MEIAGRIYETIFIYYNWVEAVRTLVHKRQEQDYA